MARTLAAILGTLTLGGCIVHEERQYTPGVTPVSREDVISLTRSGVNDEEIVQRIRDHGVDRRPGADDVIEMKNAGVSEPVLNEMLAAPVTVPRPPVEHRVVYRDYEPAVTFGAAVTGFLLGTALRTRTHVHVHTLHCRH